MITLTLSIEGRLVSRWVARKAKYRLNDAKADGGTSSQCDLRLKNSKTLRHTLRHGSLA